MASEGGSGIANDFGSDRRRVLFLIGQLGYGGSEGQLRLILENIDATEWERHVLVFHPSPVADHVGSLQAAGVRVVEMPESHRGPVRKAMFTARLMRRIRPDVVHSWTAHDNPYAAWIGRLTRAKVRWGSLRGSSTLSGFQSLPRWYRTLALRSAQKLVVNSNALLDEAQQLGIDGNRLLLLPNCVEAFPPHTSEVRAAVLEEFGFSGEHRLFGNVGNIRRVKNQVVFVRAMADVVLRHPEARGLIVGASLEGEEDTRAEIEREIDRLDLGKTIRLAGFRTDVPRLMRAMSALCVTSDSEGMPNVVLEAMAAGVPVIATDIGGIRDVVLDGKTGFLVEAGRAEAVALAMCRILNDPDFATRLADEGRRRVSRERACSVVARQLEAAYKDALADVGHS